MPGTSGCERTPAAAFASVAREFSAAAWRIPLSWAGRDSRAAAIAAEKRANGIGNAGTSLAWGEVQLKGERP